jgi:shikimate dehydrogenase
VAEIALYDVNPGAAEGLAGRLATHYPAVAVRFGQNDPAGFDLVVNATPLGMNPGDPLPVDVSRLDSRTWVGEVVMKTEATAFLQAAKARGCQVQVGTDMLFEMIPPYLEFFGFPTTTPEALRSVARLQY